MLKFNEAVGISTRLIFTMAYKFREGYVEGIYGTNNDNFQSLTACLNMALWIHGGLSTLACS